MYFSFFLLFFFLSFPCFPARNFPSNIPYEEVQNHTWSGFQKFIDIHKGSKIDGISKLKEYFHQFGYLSFNDTDFSDVFDGHFESALIRYQSKFGLPMSGKLDSSTINQLMVPRCGVSDTTSVLHPSGVSNKPSVLHERKNYAYFPGQPRWTRKKPMTLTYALSHVDSIGYLDPTDIKSVLQRAFTRWAAVIPVNFTEADEYWTADIKVGFYKGDHGDGEPFDGVLGVLGHAFSPQSGRFHLDAAETWAIDLGSEKSKDAVDLESVMTHEIGHVLGLAHSSENNAIMYPSLNPRTKKVNLQWDDVKGVQALYGSNPNFKSSSVLVSDTHSYSQAIGLNPNWLISLLYLIVCFNMIR
ncbi:hypothetical protein ACHQM5_011428 [Ranunculus cassubicifolius]